MDNFRDEDAVNGKGPPRGTEAALNNTKPSNDDDQKFKANGAQDQSTDEKCEITGEPPESPVPAGCDASLFGGQPLRPFHDNWRRYVRLGYSPVPLNPIDSGANPKAPCMLRWSPDLRRRTITEDEAREIPATAGCGFVCGYGGLLGGGLLGVDMDTRSRALQAAIRAELPPGTPIRVGDPEKGGMAVLR